MQRCEHMVLSLAVIGLMTMDMALSFRIQSAHQRLVSSEAMPVLTPTKAAELSPPPAIMALGTLQVSECQPPSGDDIWRLVLSIVGDKFGQDEDDGYNGDFFTTATEVSKLRCHYLKVLQKAAQYAGEHSNRLVTKLGRLRRILQNSHLIADHGDYKERSVRYVASIWKRITMLQSGEEHALLFPCGWTGHAVYCEVTKENENSSDPTYSFGIFNSGDGIGHHFSINTNGYDQKYSPVLFFHKIPSTEMLHPSVLRAILEPSVTYLSKQGKSMPSNPESMYQIALGRWENYLDWERSTSVMMDPQTGGTCMVHSLRHYFHYKIRYGLPPDEQHKIGQATYHVLQRAALHFFLEQIEGKSLKEIMPSLEPTPLGKHDSSTTNPRFGLTDISRSHFVRSKDLLRLVARQVMMFAPEHDATQAMGQSLLDWLDDQKAARPQHLVDVASSESSDYSLADGFLHITMVPAEPNGTAPRRRECNLPAFFQSVGPTGRVLDALKQLADITEDQIQICFGETFVDWFAAKILALDLNQVPVEQIGLVRPVFDKLEDQVRRFSATQPFPDHVAALKKILVKFQELAASLDKKERKMQGLESAPSLKQFLVTYSMDSLPKVEPANEWFMSSVQKPQTSVASTPIANPFQYVEWKEGAVLFKDQDAICQTRLYMSDSEEKASKSHHRTPEAEVGSELLGIRQKAGIQVRTAEQYGKEFIQYVRRTKALRDGLQIKFVDIDGTCVAYKDDGKVEDGHASVCMLAGKTELQLLTASGQVTERLKISSYFQDIREMLLRFISIEAGRAQRDSTLQLTADIKYKREYDPDEKKFVHFINHEWCKFSGGVRGRRLGWREGVRHKARAMLRPELDAKDEKAITQFLLRDPRTDKWEHGDYMLKRDGENAIVLYDLAHIDNVEKSLTIFQRQLFEFGIHATQTREHWLGYLQEHPKCFFKASCRVANDAILFSEKFNPATCTMAATPDTYYEHIIDVLDEQEAAMEGGEPSYEKAATVGYIHVTKHRIRWHQALQREATKEERHRGWKEYSFGRTDEVLRRIASSREGFELQKAGEGFLPMHKWLKELRYTYACIEMLVLADMDSVEQPVLEARVYQDKLMKECVALFQYTSARHIDSIDPGIIHQANRAHGRIVAKAEPSMCELMEGDFKSAQFPYLICGMTEINMLSGEKIDGGVEELQLQHLPVIVREQRFAERARSLGLKSFFQVTDGTFKLVTKDDVEYLLSTTGEGIHYKAVIHRKDPNDSEYYQLVKDAQCAFEQVVSDKSRNRGHWFTDIRELFLGSVGRDAFCWTINSGKSWKLTSVDKDDGKERVLMETGKVWRNPRYEYSVKAHTSSTHIMPEFANGKAYDLTLGSFWRDSITWYYNDGGLKLSVSAAALNAGVFTNFHEGRAWVNLAESKERNHQGFVFHGVRTPLGQAIVLQKESQDAPHKLNYDGEVWEVVEPSSYTKGQGYLLEHGVSHLLLNKGRKYSVLLPGLNSTTPPGEEGQPLCSWCEVYNVNKGSFRHDECMEYCWWGLPKRDMLMAEMVEADGEHTGMLIPKSRDDRLQIVLLMMKARKFDHAFLYMNDLDHLSSWSKQSVFLLKMLAWYPLIVRDPETNYLRLLAVKLLRDECVRFAAAGCEERLQTNTKAFKKVAAKGLSLVLQTQHLMPVYKIVDMRTRKLTRFFSENDLAADPDGLRGWISGSGKQDLLPSRESVPGQKMGACSGTGNGPDCVGVAWLRKQKHATTFLGYSSNRWLDPFPTEFFDKADVKTIVTAFADLDPDKELSNGNVKKLFAEETGNLFKESNVTATDSKLVNMFLWMQPAMPMVGKFEKEADRLAFLLRIYLSSSTTNAQWKLLQPLAEQWLFAEMQEKSNTQMMHGILQLLLSLPAGNKLNVFDAMISNFRKWEQYTNGALASRSNAPQECCDPEDVWQSMKNNMDSLFARKSATTRQNKYDWHATAPQQYYQDGAALGNQQCDPYSVGGPSASALKTSIMKIAKDNKLKSWKVYGSLPSSDEEILQVLVQLFLEGGQYKSSFPTADAKDLHCKLQHFMEATTKEAREAANGRKQTVFLEQWDVKIGRSLLVFEYSTGFTVRPEQVTQLKDLLQTTDEPRIMQIMMGGGKTAVLSPVLLQHIDHGMFMSPPGVFTQNSKDLSARSRSVYGQHGYALACYRTEKQQDITTLKWTLRELVRVRENHDYILMLPKTFQCFQNLLSMNMGKKEQYDLIMQILLELRGHFTAVVDEIDTVFDPNLEVNFPLTKADVVQDMPAMHFLSLLFDLKGYPRENTKLTLAEYDVAKTQMANDLVKRVADVDALPFTLQAVDPVRMESIANNIRSCTAPFFIGTPGRYRGYTGKDCTEIRDMQIIRMFLKDTLFNIVRMRRNVDYGRSHKSLQQTFVIPYSSANKPVEGSKFSNYLLAVGLSLQYWFLGGLDDAMFIKLIHQMRKVNADHQGATMKELYKVTHKDLPNLKNVTTEELASSDPIPPNLLKDNALIIGAIGYDVLPSISVSGKQVTNYALNIDNHLKHFIGFSGTMSSNDIFPSRSKVTEDSSVETSLRVRTVDEELHQFVPVRRHLFELDTAKGDFVKQMVTGDFSITNALLDCGAFLRDEKNSDVAAMVLEYRHDIKAVFYYDDKKNEIVTMLRGGNIEHISTSQDLHKIHPELSSGDCSGDLQDKECLSHIFLYCDQQHTVGTDLKMDYQAVAALTIASSTNLDELMQAIMRMRNYQGLQSKNVPGGASKKQDVMFVFDEKIPADLGTMWANIKKVTEKQVKAASMSVQRRNSNLEYRRLYYEKQPDPANSFKFAKTIFQREADFLSPDTPESAIARYEAVKSHLPFDLSKEEEDRVDEIVQKSAEAIRAAGSDTVDYEEEMELELEEELEMEIQRLRAHDDLNENKFTVNPMQFGPMYAFCDEVAAKSAGYEVPQVMPRNSDHTSLYPCVPISYWLEHSSGRTQPGPNMRSPVAASLAYTILRPTRKGPKSKDRSGTEADQMNLFADPWNVHSSDDFQEVKRDAQQIVDDTRKNLHNVLFIASKADPAIFQFILITSDEAMLMQDFCAKKAQRDLDIEATTDPAKVMERMSSELARIEEITQCEDGDRTEVPRNANLESLKGKYLFLRLDKGQQYQLFKKAYQDANRMKDFLKGYWNSKTCSVFDPLAIPENYEEALMPDRATREAFETAGNSVKAQLIKSMVQVLALAGSRHAVLRDDFKGEFQRAMQTPHFSKVYKEILDFIDEPLDPLELGALTAEGRQCEEQCIQEDKDYTLEPQVVDGRHFMNCVCVEWEKEVALPEPAGKSWECTTGSGAGCKTCAEFADRIGKDTCATCNAGYELQVDRTCKALECTTGSGAGCKTCAKQANRTGEDTCATCNDGYELQGDGTCKAFECTTGSGAGCKTCKEQADRKSNNACATCNPGYEIPRFGHACKERQFTKLDLSHHPATCGPGLEITTAEECTNAVAEENIFLGLQKKKNDPAELNKYSFRPKGCYTACFSDHNGYFCTNFNSHATGDPKFVHADTFVFCRVA